MTHDAERRKAARSHLALVDRHTWRLWAQSMAITFALALGLAAILYPEVRRPMLTLGSSITRALAQLVVGLLILVTLEAFYITAKQRELNELRNYILGIHEEATLLEADYPCDSLTEVLDRRALPDVLKREAAWVARFRIPLSLVLFDVRGFKRINETEGNLAGDVVLKTLAQVLGRTVRQTDTILRYGPDEFLCLLPRTDREGAETFTKRVARACQESPRLRPVPLDFGVAVYHPGDDTNQVLAGAEHSLGERRQAEEKLPKAIERPAGTPP